MEVEKSAKEYTFSLANEGTIKIREEIVKQLHTLQAVLDSFPLEASSAVIPLDPMITRALMQWIIDAYTINEARTGLVYDLDDLYRDIAYHNKLGVLHSPNYVPLLILFGDGQLPTKKDFETLFALTRALNWLEAEYLLYMVLDKIYQLLNTMTSEEIKALIKKRKLPDPTSTLPEVPYYKREELIIQFLSQSLPYELIRANRSFKQYINPINGDEEQQLFLAADGLYEHNPETIDLQKDSVLAGMPLLVASGAYHELCLTTTGLFGRGSDRDGQLGLHGINEYEVWTKLDVDGEVLLLGAGRRYTVVLTTTGLYGTGQNYSGQLGLGKDIEEASDFMRINVEGDVRGFTCAARSLFVLTTRGLYACGYNGTKNLSVESSDTFVYTLMPVIGLYGDIKDIAAGEQHTMVLTTKGLFASGSNSFGRMGDPEWDTQNRFTQLTTLPPVEPFAVYCSNTYTILNTLDGLYAAGDNDHGQLTANVQDNVHQFTKMLGVEGDVYSVTCFVSSVIILTTTGVYQSGRSLNFPTPTASVTVANFEIYNTFTKLAIEMGYFLPSLTIDDEEEEESARKQQKLQCVYCRGTAQFFTHQHTDKLAICSKYCLLKAIHS